ncbi:MAG TPA: rod shape-determining protein MreC, partial [Dehalococcoidia bacterium]|nr:rod shape-determining protein MreC [Dehalococcoidia bacterium]
KGATDRGDLLRENERFQKEIERLQAEVAAQQDASQRIQELEALLQVKEGRPQDIFLFAEVIAQDTSNIRRLIAINRGTDDGLEEGMVLVSAGGSLVGAVSRVFKDFSWVTLITDTDSAVNATVQLPSGEARGIVVGNLRHGLSLEMVPPEVALAEGALVVTSGLGGNFPSGLLIGSVRSIERKPQEPSQRAILEPAAPLSRLRGVLVLTSFVPARLQSP